MTTGIGVMLNKMFSDEAWRAAREALGRPISSLRLDDDDELVIRLEGTKAVRTLKLWDGGQSCCERRYLRTDDDLQAHVGAILKDIEVKEAKDSVSGDYGEEHEVQFLEITTSKGCFQIVAHNQHNGYYGGFSLRSGWV